MLSRQAYRGIAFLCLITIVLSLAGCGGTPTPAPVAPTAVPAATAAPKAATAAPAKPTAAPATGGSVDIYLVGATQGGGGVWDLVGTGLGNVILKANPNFRITFVPGEGVANPISLFQKKAELGLAASTVTLDAVNGAAPYKEKMPTLRGITSLFDSRMHFIVMADSPIQKIADLKDKKVPVRIAVGDAGSVTELTSQRLLAEYGISYKDIEGWGGKIVYKSMGDAASMMSDGLLDALMITGTAPQGAVSQIATSRKLRMIPIDKPQIDAMTAKWKTAPAILPKGVYNFVDQDVPTISFRVILATHTGVPDDVIYNVTKALVENIDMMKSVHTNLSTLTPEFMSTGTAVELHPGALKYYKEKGIVK